MPAAGGPAVLMDGMAQALTEIVICPGVGVCLKIGIGFIRQIYLALPVVCTPKCQRRSVFTNP